MLDGIFVHADFLAFRESAGSALVAVRLVYEAVALAAILADVLAPATDRTLEETGASITSEDAVMFSR